MHRSHRWFESEWEKQRSAVYTCSRCGDRKRVDRDSYDLYEDWGCCDGCQYGWQEPHDDDD